LKDAASGEEPLPFLHPILSGAAPADVGVISNDYDAKRKNAALIA
jgi:hypothetical protein